MLELEQLTLSAQQGGAVDQWRLATWYFQGYCVEKDELEAMRWCHLAADQGIPDAQFRLSEAYYRGECGLSKNYREAMRWLLLVAAQGQKRHLQSQAQHQIAHMYSIGEGVEKDEAAGLAWMLLAAEGGTPEAQNVLGNMYFNGNGTKQSYSEALKWYQRCMEQGGVNGTYMRLGQMYFYGLGVPQDYKQAMAMYLAAVDDRQDDYAKERIGFMYEHGLGVHQDYVEAIRWYKKLYFSNSEVDARLGHLLQHGLGAPQDYKAARAHYLKAGPDWTQSVLCNLALMYELGLGGPVNKVLALALYELMRHDFASHEVALRIERLEVRMVETDVVKGRELAAKFKGGLAGATELRELLERDIQQES